MIVFITPFLILNSDLRELLLQAFREEAIGSHYFKAVGICGEHENERRLYYATKIWALYGKVNETEWVERENLDILGGGC